MQYSGAIHNVHVLVHIHHLLKVEVPKCSRAFCACLDFTAYRMSQPQTATYYMNVECLCHMYRTRPIDALEQNLRIERYAII